MKKICHIELFNAYTTPPVESGEYLCYIDGEWLITNYSVKHKAFNVFDDWPLPEVLKPMGGTSGDRSLTAPFSKNSKCERMSIYGEIKKSKSLRYISNCKSKSMGARWRMLRILRQ